MSPTKNCTLSATPAFTAAALASAIRCRIDVDADAARAELLRRGDHDPAVAAAEVVDDVVLRDVRHLEHRGDDRVFGRNPDHVRFALRRLRRGCPGRLRRHGGHQRSGHGN